MTARAKRYHQCEDRLARHPMVHNHLPLASARSIADPAAIAVTLKDRLPQPAKVFCVLLLEGIAARTKTVGEDLISPAGTVQRSLDRFRHGYITNRCFSATTVMSTSQPWTSKIMPSSRRTVRCLPGCIARCRNYRTLRRSPIPQDRSRLTRSKGHASLPSSAWDYASGGS